MSSLSMIIIGAALLLYTVGVWGARIAGRLRWWNVALFWSGLVFDTWGTAAMLSFGGGLTLDVHGITGSVALILMLANAIGATIIMARNDEGWRDRYPAVSVGVWIIWLIPMVSPMFFVIG